MSTETLPAPVAVWDAKDRPENWTDGHTQQMAWWMQTCMTGYARDAYRVEFYMLDAPFAIVHTFRCNGDGQRYADPAADGPAVNEPVTVMLSELPPGHLR
jgi:hypothetical protein